MVDLSFSLIGFGNVGKSLVRLLQRKQNLLQEQYGIRFKITGIATGHHGIAINPGGLDLDQVLQVSNLTGLSTQPVPDSIMEFIQVCPADVLFENSPTNHKTGQPAIDYLAAAIRRGMLGITANKGPAVHGYSQLTALAKQCDSKFMFESSVMDGAPIFNMFRHTLPAAELHGFIGILNSSTNLILDRMAEGETSEQAIKYCQAIGVAETDPSADIDGWDAAIKVAILVTVLMNHPMTPERVNRTGIRGITPQMIREAASVGEKWKLVCRVHRSGDAITASVYPERIGSSSPLYAINGTSSYVQFDTDVLPGLGILESDPGTETTGYGLLSDLISALREKGMIV